MLLARDFVAHMAKDVVKRLVDGEMLECPSQPQLAERLRVVMMDEITVEDRINEEVRNMLNERQDEMLRTGVSYQEMFKKIKAHLARERKLILR